MLFKISEVAGKLNVETYVIFEKLLSNAELMKDHTQKIHSISYIDEQGIEIIRALIEGKSPEQIKSPVLNEPEEKESDEVQIPAEPNTESEPSDEVDEDWLTEDDFIIIDAEKTKLRDEISQLRRELIQHDSELKRLDDAISNYQILMREDVDYLIQLEEKLETVLLRRSFQENSKDESSSMFGFRRK